MAIDLQKTLDNIRKKQGTYIPSTGKGDEIDLNKTLENVRAKGAVELEQRRAQMASEKLKARKMATSPLSARAAETLAGLQEGTAQPKLHPTGGPLKVSQDTLRDLGMVNENGFVLGGVDPADLGLDAEDMAALLKVPQTKPQEVKRWEPAAEKDKLEFKDYIGYLAGEFGAGMLSSPAGIMGGATTAIGDIATGGQVSAGAQALANYFAQKPQMLQRWMANEIGVEQMIMNETGVSAAALAAYRTANTDDWLRQSLQEDRGHNLEDWYKENIGQGAYTIGQQVPGMIYSMGAPATDGGGILSSVASAIKNKSGVGQALAGSVKTALKGNVNTWLMGGGAAGNQLTELAKQKGFDPQNYINAMGNGFVEYITEGMLGFSDAPSVAAIWRNTGRKGSNALKAIVKWLQSSAEEGLEEVINVPMSGIVDKMTVERDKKLVGEGGIFDLKEMLRSGIAGAAVGMIMGGVGGVSSIRNAVLEGASIFDAATATNHLIDTMPKDMRPAHIDPKTATAETLEQKQAEVLDALEHMVDTATVNAFEQGTEQTVQSDAQSAPQMQTEAVQNNEQSVDINQEALNNEQTEILSGRGPQRGSDPIDAGSAGQVERAGTAAAARRNQQQIAQRRTSVAEQNGLRRVSSRELGLGTGTDLRRNVVLEDESLWDDELRSIKKNWDDMNRRRREKYGYTQDMELKFVLGKMQARDADGADVLVDGVVNDDGSVCVCVNSMTRSATEIAEHEEFHALVGDTPELVEALWPAVESVGLNDAMVERYRQFYGETLGYGDQMVREEILADAYAGLERIKGTGMQTVKDMVRQLTGEAQEAIERGWYTPAAEETYESVDGEGRETRGPPTVERFSMSAPVERTDTLIALHNMTEEKLRRTLDLGAWPAPSIAIVRAEQGHEDYGDYSAVFPRKTIDPKEDRRNRVYGSDAWTPTHNDALIESEVNYDAAIAFDNMIYDLSSKFAGGTFTHSSRLRGILSDESTNKTLDDVARSLAKSEAVQAAYLQERGETLEPAYEEKVYGDFGSDTLEKLIETVGPQELDRLNRKPVLENEDIERVKDVIMEKLIAENEDSLRQEPGLREIQIQEMRSDIDDYTVRMFIGSAWAHYVERGENTNQIDREATAQKMIDMILPGARRSEVEQVVQDWVRPKLEGILGESGIYSERGRITNRWRRSFRQTHYPVTAENIVRAMYEQRNRRGNGANAFDAIGLASVTTPEYRSVSEIHADEERLRTEDDEIYEELMQGINAEIRNFIERTAEKTEAHESDPYMERYNIAKVLTKAAGQNTVKGVQRVFRKEGYRITTELAQAAMDLYNKAAATPTKYFEAKPERVVEFGEALALIAPDDAPARLMQRMKDAGMNVITYAAGDEASRIRALNSVSGAKFSVSDEVDSKYAPTFYSHMERVIENTKQEKLGAASVVSMLKGKGVKNEEIKWSGIETFLEGKKSVTKQELLEFMRGNQLQIERVDLRETLNYTDEQRERLDELEEENDRLWSEVYDLWKRVFDEEMPINLIESNRKLDMLDRKLNAKNLFRAEGASELREAVKAIELNDYWVQVVVDEAKMENETTKWKSYTLEDGENYREYLFRMPDSDYSNEAMRAHWGNRTGVLAHARVQDFAHNDEPVLFVEEIQSDWHNAGQKFGYGDAQAAINRLLTEQERVQNELDSVQDVLDDYNRRSDAGEYIEDYYEVYDRYRDLNVEIEDYRRRIRNMGHGYMAPAPDAPYAKTYHEFVLKNLLREAAENGYAYLAWTPGWMQEERWDSEYAEGYRIEYDQDIPKFLNKYGKQWGARVGDIELDGMRNMSVHAIPITESMKRSVLYEGQPMYSVSDEQKTTEPQRRDLTPGQELTRKEHTLIKRAINQSKMQLRDIVPAGTKEAREVQQMQILDLAQKLWETGEIAQENIDDAFEEIWLKGATVDRELADQYAELRAALRTGVSVSEDLKKEITDYGQFRRANFGLFTVRSGQQSDVDIVYQELSGQYPSFFPENITEPADQLQQMADVAQRLKPVVRTMSEQYKGDVDAKAGMKADFVDLVRSMELEILHPVQEITKKERDQKEAERAISFRQIYREVMEEVFKVQQRETFEPNPEYWHEMADDVQKRMNERAEAIQNEWLRSLTKEGFKGTESLDELGVKIAGSVADYHLVGQVLENHRAAKAVRNDIRNAERKLKATSKEKNYAAGIASGVFTEADISGDARPHVVLELADYYMMERVMGLDLISERRKNMYADVDYQVEKLMSDKATYRVSPSPVLFYRTPQRNMIKIYGREHGQKVYDYLFAPVAENEAERLRWTNKMFDEVRLVEGSDGKKKQLNREERALVQLLMEGRAVAEVVAAMEEREIVYDAAANLRNGQDIEDIVRQFNLNQEMRNAVVDYATWLDTNDILETTKGIDQKKIDNAVVLYAKQYDKFYKAINDFLAAHGYEPIGFINGYAPHFQPERTKNMLEKTLTAMGLSSDVAKLPTAIAGLTHVYRPNKRWDPHFLKRRGKQTEYDVAAGYERYLDYLSDILFHMDDTVRIRRAANYFRREGAPQEITEQIKYAQGLRMAPKEEKADFLRQVGSLSRDSNPSEKDVDKALDGLIDNMYKDWDDKGKYNSLVNWLEDYANQLTGKQSMVDRGTEILAGRTSLNFANKLNRAFQRANVAGNLSTALNQTAQLPMIVADIGHINTVRALFDYARGIARRDGFREKSDFLTARKGINNLVVDPADRIINIMFTPAQVADDMMSYAAVRGAYIKAVRQGMSDAEAMRYADRKAEQIMGSRAKGSAPQAFRSKNPLVRMVNMFQTEALNAFEYVEQDLIIQGIKDIKQIDDSKGRAKATAALIGLLGKMLIAALVWNRVTEELYGGSPAQFDLLGYAANFLASGNGLTANQQLLDWIDMAWERAFGEPLLDIDPEYNEEFDWKNAMSDLGYAVSSDIPLVRNIAGLLGVGDQSLPMPDMSKVYDAGKSLWDNGASLETLDAALAAVGQFVPGGRQINKTYQGARTMAKGGRYYGYGENQRLQYPVEDSTSNWVKALLFGPSGLSENTEFYAAGGDDGLSAGNTRKYQELMQAGMTSEMALETYEEYRRINRLEDLTASEKATEFAKWLADMEVPAEQAKLAREAFVFWGMVPGEATKYDTFVGEGLEAEDAYALTEALGALEPEEGETTVSNLQRYRAVLDHTTDEAVRYAALAGVMQAKEFARLRAAYDYVQSGTYVEFLEAFEDAYPGETKSQERVETVLRQMRLDAEERAALWQMCGPKWKTDNNPFSKSVGREVAGLIEEYYAEINGE